MRIVAFSPYGTMSEETGAIYLLSRYLKEFHPGVAQLRCNGMFALCDRDGETGGNRTLLSCRNCIHEQNLLSQWGEFNTYELSRYLTPEDITRANYWIHTVAAKDLTRTKFEDVEPFKLGEELFYRRLQMQELDLENINHLKLLKQVITSALRATLAARHFISSVRPDLSLVAGGKDYIVASYIAEAERKGSKLSCFSWDLPSRSIVVTHPESGEVFNCPMVFDGLHRMRPDPKTWPVELTEMLGQLVDFLGIPTEQMTLPIAAN